MASRSNFKGLINSWIDEIVKLLTNSGCCCRRKTRFSDQKTSNQGLEPATTFHTESTAFVTTLKEDMNKLPIDSSMQEDQNLPELPNDMLEEIISRLDSPEDYMHSVAVCRRWRDVGQDLRIRSISRTNILFFHTLPRKYSFPVLLHPDGRDGDLHYFYNITKRDVKKIHIPELSNKCIPGSWRGWLATIDIKKYTNPINLLNPITKMEISLPNLPSFSPQHSARSYHIEKIIIVAPEEVINLSSCKVVVLEDSRSSLYICRIGDGKWNKIISPTLSHICDVIEFKGVIYFVAYNGKLSAIETDPVTKITPIVTEGVTSAHRYYLVESSGDLLLISRSFSGYSDKKTTLFKVYILQNEHGYKIWKEVESLHNRVLFVGRSRTLCLDTNLYPKCEGNRIYFADDDGPRDGTRAYMVFTTPHERAIKIPNDNGVYHMATKKFEYFGNWINNIHPLPAIWFSPNPW